MKYVRSNVATYDASYGRIEPGGTYYVEDDVAQRWANAGVASITDPPKEPEKPEEDEDEDEDEQGEEQDDKDPEELAAEARKFHEAGDSERMIAQKLGIPRTRVHTLLSGKS